MAASSNKLGGSSPSSASKVFESHGHAFKKTYFKKFTWCAQCNDFIWGVSEPQGYQCKVCNMVVHKKCLKEADSLTSCSEFISKAKSKGKSVSGDKLLERVAVLTEQVKEDVLLEPVRVESFLALVVGLDDDALDDSRFDCFRDKLVADGPTPGVNAQALSFCLSDDTRWDVLSCLVGWVLKNPDERAQKCALMLLNALLTEDTNKFKFVQRRHAHHFTKFLHLFDFSVMPKTFRIVQCSGMSTATKERLGEKDFDLTDYSLKRLFLEHLPGDVSNTALGSVIGFLHKLTKVKIRQTDFKETFKEERQFVGDALMTGSQFVNVFYKSHDKSFQALIDNKKGLALVLLGANSGVFNMHKEISENEVSFGRMLYDSILCTVYEGIYRGHKVAIKAFNPKGLGFTWEGFRKEISLLAAVQHPNICRLHGACTAPTSPRPFLVMDLFERGSIKDVVMGSLEKVRAERCKESGEVFSAVKPLPVDTSLIVNMAMQAANGIAYLHSKAIVHRDIKPGNFLVDDHYGTYVIDFGVSRVAAPNPNEKMTLVGTPSFMAPEVLDAKPYDEKADTYSFVLVLWSMITGREPFEGVDPFNLAEVVVLNKERPVIPPTTHPGLAYLMHRGWDDDPKVRPGMDELLAVLWNMQDPLTHRHYCRIYDHVPDALWVQHILPRLPRLSFLALGCTSKRFYSLIYNNRMLISPLASPRKWAVSHGTHGASPVINNNSGNDSSTRKNYSASVGTARSSPVLGSAAAAAANTRHSTSLNLPIPSSATLAPVPVDQRRKSWLAGGKSPRRLHIDTPPNEGAEDSLKNLPG